MGSTLDRVPAHLRGVVVQQDYSRYSEIDQAVWRFVVLQMFARLKHTAHAAYAHGLADTGMSLERIPAIADMDSCLANYGWGAVCVDGFIAPRAFVEFQALGILPIAADIRTADHLAYTPAPDIIHEAAGHAPLLVDTEYAAFLKRIGSFGARAFSSAEDRKLYDAIYLLSEVKEDPASTPAQVQAAEARLERAAGAISYVTEAARIARLYWWTAEYGLVGTPENYRLYGAGLLSSLAESHFCHDPKVQKLPLTADCVKTDYDITRPQPQLFVARNFAHANEVLDEVASTLACRSGGMTALTEAKRSGEICTIELDSGLQLTGKLTDFSTEGEQILTVTLAGPCAVSQHGKERRGWGPDVLNAPDYVFCAGPLSDGRPLHSLTDAALERMTHSGRLELCFASGVRASGTVVRCERARDEKLELIQLDRCQLRLGDLLLFDSRGARYPLVATSTFRSACAGAADAAFYPAQSNSGVTVPRPRELSAATRELLDLYEQALAIWKMRAGSDIAEVFHGIHRRLVEQFPDEWLLRWNLFESLLKVGEHSLDAELRDELQALELRYAHHQPIGMGLKYLAERFGHDPGTGG